MNPIAVSSIVSVCIFTAALAGIALRRALPEEHLGSDAKEVVRLATGLIATMAALVLGMLVSSAKASYDTRKNEVAELSSTIIGLDQILASYGPEARQSRAELRQLVVAALERIWPVESSRLTELKPTGDVQSFYAQLQALVPKDSAQAAAKAGAVALADSLRRERLRMFIEAEQTSMSIPLLIVVVAWLMAIFIGFGLFAPTNPTVIITLVICALAVSSAIFIIMEMYTPFSGILRIPADPIRAALSQIGR